ncbi:MAG: hypothetical protein DRN04_04830 [Thermoprotei archaeon]|nr:MAG: hypothetical protein DRN04_04830 [Thermoprotei archaeon]
MAREALEVERLLISARRHFERALYYLGQAETKSLVDMFLGGLFSAIIDIMEYDDYKKALREIDYAKYYLKQAEKYSSIIPELDDSNLWFITDVAFDSLFADLLRHFKIMEAKRQVENAIREIDEILYRLRSKYRGSETEVMGEEDTAVY